MTDSVWSGKDPGDITRMINLANAGDVSASEELLPLIYHDLKLIAARQRRRQGKPSDMLNTTAVVNEAWLRLQGFGQSYDSHNHYLALAAIAMRQLLVDEARRQMRKKRGGGDAIHVTVGDNARVEDQAAWLVSLDGALEKLGEFNPRLRDVFQFRFFIGLTEDEIGNVLDISKATVQRDWRKAKAMLAVAL